jgi:hypothetical protein
MNFLLGVVAAGASGGANIATGASCSTGTCSVESSNGTLSTMSPAELQLQLQWSPEPRLEAEVLAA